MLARTTVACGLVLLLNTVASLLAQETFTPAAEVAGIAGQLCAAKLRPLEDEFDLPDTVVPEAVRELLPAFKRALRECVHHGLTTHFSEQGNPHDFREKLLGELREAGVLVGRGADSNCPYGAVRDIRVEHVNDHRRLLAVVVTLSIPCGSDSSLYIFERGESGWNLVLADEAQAYEEVRGGYDAFDYSVSPPDEQGRWYVVTANNTPWCTSCWNGMQYRVLRPSNTPEAPSRLFTGSRGTYRCQDRLRRIVTGPDEFGISFYGMFVMDFDSWIRIHIVAHRVMGNTVVRVPPLALAAQDFVDEWFLIPWEEAAQWSAGDRLTELKRWHGILGDSKDKPWLKFNVVQQCPEEQRWVVGTEPQGRKDNIPAWVYFVVSKRGDIFSMEAITDTRPPDCPGDSPPDKEIPKRLP